MPVVHPSLDGLAFSARSARESVILLQGVTGTLHVSLTAGKADTLCVRLHVATTFGSVSDIIQTTTTGM